MPLPSLTDLELAAELASPTDSSGFLRLEKLRLRIAGGEPFAYDVVTRRAMDAVVIAAHFRRDGQTQVAFVSAVRPPLHWRARGESALWELPAGLVEPGESFRAAAARELFEEVGVRAQDDALHELGPNIYPAPAMIAEVHAFFHVEIDWDARVPPPGDASALERAQRVATVSLDEALSLCARGEIRDAKTELGLRRLREVLA